MKYAFVDGGYLREYYREAMRAFFGEEGALDFNLVRNALDAQKLFYYDSIDEEPKPGESEDETRIRAEAMRIALDRIQASSGCHVRMGSMAGSAKRKRQKQVDVLLAVELLTHAFRENLDQAALLAGDLDFKPVVDSLIGLGTWVEVRYVRSHAAAGLLAAADQQTEINLVTFYQWSEQHFQRTHPFPNALGVARGVPGGWHIVDRGRLNERDALLLRHDDGLHAIQVSRYFDTNDLQVSFKDQAKLAQYFEMVYGDITWAGRP